MPAIQFTLQGTNTYIVGTGSARLIIDTGQGIPEWAGLISSTLTSFSTSLSHVFLTHWHGDHTGGVPDLLRLYPHLSTSVYKNSPAHDQQPIEDGQAFRVEGATVRAVHSPGHSHDHMCFILEEENVMFTGDNVLGHGTSAVEELSIFMESLRVMASHGCKLGYPAHGDVIRDLPDKISSEIAQKLRRERQVLQAMERFRTEQMRAGGSDRGRIGRISVRDLVTLMHGDELDEEVRRMALEPFIDEVLRKMAEDGKVAFEISGGEKKWFTI
jgi:glyoxylase-like metal-dependent hydrolase (beta-lactamase superfamily II)